MWSCWRREGVKRVKRLVVSKDWSISVSLSCMINKLSVLGWLVTPGEWRVSVSVSASNLIIQAFLSNYLWYLIRDVWGRVCGIESVPLPPPTHTLSLIVSPLLAFCRSEPNGWYNHCLSTTTARSHSSSPSHNLDGRVLIGVWLRSRLRLWSLVLKFTRIYEPSDKREILVLLKYI